MNVRDDFFLYKNDNINKNIKLSAKSKRRMNKSKADNTLKSYSADWNDFTYWCDIHKVNPLPCTPETIVNYINDLADHAKANTVSRRVTAISENHIAAGFHDDNPTKTGMVINAMQAIRREKGTFQHGKAPILMETMSLLADLFDAGDLVSIRDKALLFLGFAGAFRRSELVGIDMQDISFTPQGLVVFIPQSKGDQLGRGSQIAVPYAPDPHVCAVTAVREWINAAGITSGPLFRGFKRNLEPRETQLTDKAVALIVKKYMAMLGMNPDDFAGHSLRRGFATSAAQHDLDALSIMRQTRHKSEKMVHRYIEQGNLFKENPLNRMFGSSTRKD
ncbi:site-specific integrase [Anaerovibrio sp.]|uniref:site-specific integrase n=1 Tax=Anaerovibrio sp. TaxID=1872532 RepID=UPI001B4564D7|nr:site-specific integrase [Anaerovibrio sp.]MBP3231485.1 site-specific integrase [Anaerovibrio sp.]MBR2143720.1 site-specific integrase [Anaerovibrio sp.]